jgi:tetratricopeptide (TPR) repeat protein
MFTCAKRKSFQNEMVDNLRHLDETSNKLLKGGHFKEAIYCINFALQRRKELFGNSHAFNLSCLNSAATFIHIAMNPNHDMNTKSRISLLGRAEELSQSNDTSKIVVWYNLAKLYQLKNDLNLAYKYLKMALGSQSSPRENKDHELSIELHLNMTSVLSELNKHKMALCHAKLALALVEGYIANQQEQHILRTETIDGKEDSTHIMVSLENISRNWLEILALSYYNVGTQYEHLNDLKASSDAYECGVKVAALLLDDCDIKRDLEVAHQDLKTRILDDEATNDD